jgi:aspartate/methionine/tyrosine aminotransferase
LSTVPLTVNTLNEWVFDADLLASTITDKTRLLILNTPHNPTGKCFTLDELDQITDIVKRFPNLTILADEVYDFLTFDGYKHVPFASIGDNWNRTITVYSGGKLMNATGWKVGWAIAHPQLLKLGGIINNNMFYCQNTPGQVAMSQALPLTDKASDGKISFVENARVQFS